MLHFKEIYHFSRFQRGSNIFQGGPTFSRGGGGFNCLFPIETHITCDFPGGSDPLSPLWIRTCKVIVLLLISLLLFLQLFVWGLFLVHVYVSSLGYKDLAALL